jgi:integrase
MFHLVFPTVLKVMYCCGLRVSETLMLRVKDVDLNDGSIFVNRSKFENSRRLPVSKSLLYDLRAYHDANRELIGVDEESFFFPNANGERYSQRTVYDKFRTVLWSCEIPHQGRGKGPRVHDLRHTFAVRSLQQSIMAGKDLYVFLPILMSYLGHIKLSSTEYYLRLTAEMFPDFLRRSDTVCAAAIPEVCEYD